MSGAIEIERSFDTSAELVFEAWTQAERLTTWLGPEGFVCKHVELDVRVGGTLAVDMLSPDGTSYRFVGSYREVSPPARLVFTWGTPATGETVCTVQLTSKGQRTHMHFKQTNIRQEEIAGYRTGWEQSIAKLTQSISSL